MSIKFPSPLRFELQPGPIRSRVLAAAEQLGLAVTHDDDLNFSVLLRSAEEAYNFGAHCGPVGILSRKRGKK